MSRALPIILCGKSPVIATSVSNGLKPEIESKVLSIVGLFITSRSYSRHLITRTRSTRNP